MSARFEFEPQDVPLLDIPRNNAPLRDELLAAIANVVDSARFLYGPEVRQLEAQLAALSETKWAVGCASGSDALLLSLMALDIGAGDEVIVPSFTFFATASAVRRVGAQIVFVDIDPQTFNIDPQRVAAAITPRTKAVVPVHLFGQCAQLESLCEICTEHGIHVIEDAAQAVGAKYRGRAAGSWGATGCYSFYPTKNLGGCGDGGMITTRDDQLAERLRLLSAHGMNPRYVHRVVGINSRLDTIQAAALTVKLRHLAGWTAERRVNAQRYQQLFSEAKLESIVRLPYSDLECEHVWNQYTIRILDDGRDQLRGYLAEQGVGTEVYYPHSLHLQECFRCCGYGPGSLPASEQAAREVLSLPIFPGLRLAEQRAVVGRIAEFYQGRRASTAA